MNWGQAVKNWGQVGKWAAGKAWGAGGTARGAMIGAGVGGAWGAVSDDTSVLGGMAMGAAGGAAVGRYGGAGKAMWGSKYGQKLGGGARIGASARQAGVQAGADARSAWGKAKGWWGGNTTVASNVAKPPAALPSGPSIASSASAQNSPATGAAIQQATNAGPKIASNSSVADQAVFGQVSMRGRMAGAGMSPKEQQRTMRRAARSRSRSGYQDEEAMRYRKTLRGMQHGDNTESMAMAGGRNTLAMSRNSGMYGAMNTIFR